jgi:hypothetical protein
MYKKITLIFILFTILFPVLSPCSDALFNRKPVIRVAIIRQNWDMLDKSPTSVISTRIHTHYLRKEAKRYGYRVKVFEFWDSWFHGDVQSGKLRWKGIDVVIAPGGVGGWYTPFKYRYELRKFVRRGGGFYGICGDSTFGSLGVKHMNMQYNSLITKLLGYNELSPMLGLVNVYTDASALQSIIRNPKYFSTLDMIQFLSRLPISRARIHFRKTIPAIQKPYMGSSIRMMLGNAPLVSGPVSNNLFMPKVITLATFARPDKPYDRDIKYTKAIVASTYGFGRVVLSPLHAEFTIGNAKAHDVYIRNVLWLAGELSSAENT